MENESNPSPGVWLLQQRGKPIERRTLSGLAGLARFALYQLRHLAMVHRKYLCAAPRPDTWDERAEALLTSLGGHPDERHRLVLQTLSALEKDAMSIDRKKSGPGRKSNAEHAIGFYRHVLSLHTKTDQVERMGDGDDQTKETDSVEDDHDDDEPPTEKDSKESRKGSRKVRPNQQNQQHMNQEQQRNQQLDLNEDAVEELSASATSIDSQEFFLNQHNDLCEVCNLGGELLCCSTCNLVFHLQCTRPALKQLPPDHWSCAYCIASGATGHKRDSKTRRRAQAAVRLMDRLKDGTRGDSEESKSEENNVDEDDNQRNQEESEQGTDPDGVTSELAAESPKEEEETRESQAPSEQGTEESEVNVEHDKVEPCSTRKQKDDSPTSINAGDTTERRTRRERRQPTLFDPQTCAASEWQSDGVFEWKSLGGERGVSSNDDDIERSEEDVDRKETKEVKTSDEPIWCNFCKDDANVPVCCFCACRVCFGKHDAPNLLLCDKCDDEYHTYCLDPPLASVPNVRNWFCPSCSRESKKELRHISDNAKSPRLSGKQSKHDRLETRSTGGTPRAAAPVSRKSVSPQLGSNKRKIFNPDETKSISRTRANSDDTSKSRSKETPVRMARSPRERPASSVVATHENAATPKGGTKDRYLKSPKRPLSPDASNLGDSNMSKDTPVLFKVEGEEIGGKKREGTPPMKVRKELELSDVATEASHGRQTADNVTLRSSAQSSKLVIQTPAQGAQHESENHSDVNVAAITKADDASVFIANMPNHASESGSPSCLAQSPQEKAMLLLKSPTNTEASKSRSEYSPKTSTSEEQDESKSSVRAKLSDGTVATPPFKNSTSLTIERSSQVNASPTSSEPERQRSRSGRPVKRNSFHDEIDEGEQHLRSSRSPLEQQKQAETDSNMVEVTIGTKPTDVLQQATDDVTDAHPMVFPSKGVMTMEASPTCTTPVTSTAETVSAGLSVLTQKSSNPTVQNVASQLVPAVISAVAKPSVTVGPSSSHVSPAASSAPVKPDPEQTTSAEPAPAKVPRRKPGARECMQISRRFGVQAIPQKYMDTLLDYCTRGKVEHLIRMRERLDDHSRMLEAQLAGLEALIQEKGELDIVVPQAEVDTSDIAKVL